MIPNPIAGLQSLGWVWPCVQCGGCQTAAPGVASEVAFGIDWPSAESGPNNHGSAVTPLATLDTNIDLSSVPNNSVGIVRMTIMWFQTTGTGAANLVYDMAILALRDDNGDLHCDLNSWAGTAVNALGVTVFAISSISTPDNDTVQLQVQNLSAESAIVFFRDILSIVYAGVPVPPP